MSEALKHFIRNEWLGTAGEGETKSRAETQPEKEKWASFWGCIQAVNELLFSHPMEKGHCHTLMGRGAICCASSWRSPLHPTWRAPLHLTWSSSLYPSWKSPLHPTWRSPCIQMEIPFILPGLPLYILPGDPPLSFLELPLHPTCSSPSHPSWGDPTSVGYPSKARTQGAGSWVPALPRHTGVGAEQPRAGPRRISPMQCRSPPDPFGAGEGATGVDASTRLLGWLKLGCMRLRWLPGWLLACLPPPPPPPPPGPSSGLWRCLQPAAGGRRGRCHPCQAPCPLFSPTSSQGLCPAAGGAQGQGQPLPEAGAGRRCPAGSGDGDLPPPAPEGCGAEGCGGSERSGAAGAPPGCAAGCWAARLPPCSCRLAKR